MATAEEIIYGNKYYNSKKIVNNRNVFDLPPGNAIDQHIDIFGGDVEIISAGIYQHIKDLNGDKVKLAKMKDKALELKSALLDGSIDSNYLTNDLEKEMFSQIARSLYWNGKLPSDAFHEAAKLVNFWL